MGKSLALLFAIAPAIGMSCSTAEAWDNRGHGAYRNGWGRCVSNYGGSSGCPYGYHLGCRLGRPRLLCKLRLSLLFGLKC